MADEQHEETTGVSRDEIARRAHEISLGDDAGTDEENWLRAERELRGEGNVGTEPWAKTGSGDTESITSD